jgi:hypothetical protein
VGVDREPLEVADDEAPEIADDQSKIDDDPSQIDQDDSQVSNALTSNILDDSSAFRWGPVHPAIGDTYYPVDPTCPWTTKAQGRFSQPISLHVNSIHGFQLFRCPDVPVEHKSFRCELGQLPPVWAGERNLMARSMLVLGKCAYVSLATRCFPTERLVDKGSD